MNRTQKKCFMVSVGLHLLLPAIVLVGSGFFSRPKPDNTSIADFIASKTLDSIISGGGDNKVKTPPAQLVVPPAPQTPQTPVVEKTPTPPPLPEVKPDPIPVEPPAHPKTSRNHIEPDTHEVVRNASDIKAAKDAAKAREAARRRQEADAVGKAVAGIRGGVSGATEIKVQPGPGGGGPTYGNFYSQVKRVYWDAWLVPDGSPNVIVKASVTIGRDGNVISARITQQSGNAAVDTSVQMTLDRVKFVAPLPEDSRDDQRTVPLSFNTEAKLTG